MKLIKKQEKTHSVGKLTPGKLVMKRATSGMKKNTAKKEKPAKAPKLEELATVSTPLSEASSTRLLCLKCTLHLNQAQAFTKPWVPQNYTGKMVVVTPGPVAGDRPLSKQAGRVFVGLAKTARLSPDDIAYVPAVRCPSESPTMTQIRCCRPFLLHALSKLRPTNVLGLGKHALRSLSNKSAVNIIKARGKAVMVPGL